VEFSECSPSYTRSAYFYYLDRYPLDAEIGEEEALYCIVDDHVAPAPRPIHNLPCHDGCPDGTFANVDLDTKQYACDPCPSNMYSVGNGGIRIDGKMGAFGKHGDEGSRMPLRMT